VICLHSFRSILFALVAGVLTLGCDTGKKDSSSAAAGHAIMAPAGEPLKLAFVSNNASDFWKIAAAGVKKYEHEANIHIDFKIPPTAAVAEQNRILEDLTSQGYNGLAISVIAPDDQVSEINSARRKMNVICQDSDAPKSDRLLYIGTNNYEAGKVLGQEIVKLLPSGGKMAVFVGTFSADNARQRLKGIEEAIAGHNIDIVAKKEDGKDDRKARSNVEDVINGYPDVSLMCGLWSYNGPAIASAIEASGKKDKIKAAVFDEENDTLKGIEDGTIAVTVVQKPFQFGYLSSKMLHLLATKGDEALKDPMIKDGKIDTGVEVINADNVKDFSKRLAELKKTD